MNEWITLSKLLPQFIYPFNLVLWLFLLSLVFFFFRLRRLQGTTLLAICAILLICGSPLSLELYRRHEQQYLPMAVDQLPNVDAIVLLGGDIGLPLSPRLESEVRGNRIVHSFRLYRAGKAKIIVISGGNVFPQKEVQAESFYTRDLLIELGVPADSIMVEVTSRNTYENARETKKLLEANQHDKILLVTSAFHMPRALSVFRTLGIDAIPAPASYSIVNYSQPAILDWMPSLGNLGKMQAVIHENLGILVYRYRGWIL